MPDVAANIINCCCVLHNICVDSNLPTIEGNDEDIESINAGYMVQPPLQQPEQLLIEGQNIRSTLVCQYF